MLQTGWCQTFLGFQQARSLEAEKAIEAAEALMRGDTDSLPDGLRSKKEIEKELKRVLAGHDDFLAPVAG